MEEVGGTTRRERVVFETKVGEEEVEGCLTFDGKKGYTIFLTLCGRKGGKGRDFKRNKVGENKKKYN